MSDNAEIAKSFLSHNSRDKPAVEVIQGLLERGDLPRGERPIPCWFDKDDLRSQGTWMSQLEDAVAKCGAAVVFYGPDGHGPVHTLNDRRIVLLGQLFTLLRAPDDFESIARHLDDDLHTLAPTEPVRRHRSCSLKMRELNKNAS